MIKVLRFFLRQQAITPEVTTRTATLPLKKISYIIMIKFVVERPEVAEEVLFVTKSYDWNSLLETLLAICPKEVANPTWAFW